MTLAVSTYAVVLAVHIVAVVAAFGLPLAYPLLVPYVRRHHAGALAAVHDVQYRLNQRITAPGTVVILAAGIYMASDADVWGEAWVIVGLAAILAIGAIGGAVIVPATQRLSELARTDVGGAAYERTYRRYMTAEIALAVLVIVTIFFMTAKPFA